MTNFTNPYSAGTGNSKLFRIPSILTLKNGRVIAGGDIRYGNGTDDPANIETVIRYSDDNCQTWSDVVWVNHFNDMEDCDHTKAVPTSASFCDSAMCQDKDGVVYHVCDACPAYMGLWSAGTYGKGNGYIDGKLALCDKTSHEKAESTTLDKKHYPYYVDNFNEDGFAPVLRFSDNSSYKNYFVDRFYNIYEKNGEEYSPVLIKQMNKDGSLNDNDVIANIFYAYAPIKIYPTYYLWVRKSFDNGESWSEGKILNLEIGSKGFTGFSPGVGICIEKDGKQRVIFSVYDNNDAREYTSVIYTDDGENWKRSKKANQVGLAGKSSESQFALLNNGVLRMYSRNIAGYISYTDSTDYGETWSSYTIDKALGYCSNCMFSVINYSKKIDGKDAIILACPSTNKRKLGVIKIGLYDESNKVEWKYNKKVTDSLNPFSYVYSCITELSDGSIVDLYESDKAEFSLKGYSLDELKVTESNKLSLVDSIKSKIYNKTRK
ncbi:MAG: exo-alpha-sialidase [Clostridia bacterium]|nr:exo-alpha-sialidase [Clostridia bacterium]MBP3559670.1 exo-alpha-sialidase [Clostridia bacterium]